MKKSSALTVPEFRVYFMAAIFGTMAIWMTRFLYAWMVWEYTKSAFWVGVASAGLLLPSLIVTPIFGVISDRINLKKGIVSWQFAQGVITALTAIILKFQPPSLPLLMTIIVVFGIVASAGSPLRLTILPKLVGKNRLSSAVGYGAILFNSSRVIAPAFSAWLLSISSEMALLWVCTMAFALAAVINLRLPSFKQPENKPEALPWYQEFMVGVNISWQSPFIRILILLTFINSFTGRTLMELLPAFSGTLSSGSAADLATLIACAGIGSIIGGIFMSRQRNELARLKNILLLSLGFSLVFIIALLLTRSLAFISFCVGMISLLMTLFGTGSQIILQIQTDENTRGRVMSLWLTIAIAGPAMGAFLMGWVTEISNFTVTFMFMAALTLLCGVLLQGHKKKMAQHQNAPEVQQ
ncbi:MFS transporter [Reinekea marina]|uniref:MFS transporter n=1 Tax=Reinekea marina TaxID=1310421 RepID=A0ABV7WRS3_9GAMM|nr:MFS transporter [Reinekea marina]MDN3650604.1 MFS transporter [Reinekea marina]